MHLVTIGWIYVVLMMAIVEATSDHGTVHGALVTFLLYGLLPMSIVLYVMGTPARRRRRQAADAAAAEGTAERAAAGAADGATAAPAPPSAHQPDGRSHAAGDPVAAERKEA